MLSQKNTQHIILFLFFLLQFSSSVLAQSRFFFSAGAGIVYYNGDLRDKRLLPPAKLFHLVGDLNLGYNIDRHLDLTLNYFRGKVDCADSLANENDNILRNQNFRSKINEVNLMLRFKLFRIDKRAAFNPYIMAGFGTLFFNPQGNYNGEWVDLHPLGTEGQYVLNSEENYPEPYKLRTYTVPVGFGLLYSINQKWKIKAEFIQHFSFTDYLDDTSTKYPDSSELSATPSGYLATLFSSRRKDGFPDYRRSRGNSGANDNYVNISIGILYNPARKKSYEFRKTNILHRLFSGKKGWWGNRGNGLK